MTSLAWPIPPKPATFSPDGAPDGVEVLFVNFAGTRPLLDAPLRSALVHTNGAENEGSVKSSWGWAHARPGSNTCPHYQVDRRARNDDGIARKMLPSNRRAIANATVDAYQDGRGDIAWWSLAIETADLGWPTPNRPDAPGGTVGFTDLQGETIAQILAYEAVVSPALLLSLLDQWYGSGIGGHTDPFGYPYTTLAKGKACPGDAKKAEIRSWIIPRAAAIHRAWTTTEQPVVIPPTPLPTPDPEETVMEGARRTLFIPRDADAQFIGWADELGAAIEVVWVDKQRADAHRGVPGLRLDDGLSIGGFSNCVLLGPLPTGDTRHQWTGAEFFRHVA